MYGDFAVSPSPYLLNDADFEPSVAYHVDAVVHLPRSEQDGPCWHKLGLHMLAELNEERLLKVTKGPILHVMYIIIINDTLCNDDVMHIL